MRRVVPLLVLAAFLAAVCAGCGRKGDPELPPGDTVNTLAKRQYPQPDE